MNEIKHKRIGWTIHTRILTAITSSTEHYPHAEQIKAINVNLYNSPSCTLDLHDVILSKSAKIQTINTS